MRHVSMKKYATTATLQKRRKRSVNRNQSGIMNGGVNGAECRY